MPDSRRYWDQKRKDTKEVIDWFQKAQRVLYEHIYKQIHGPVVYDKHIHDAMVYGTSAYLYDKSPAESLLGR